MSSQPVYTSKGEGFRAADEIASLRPIAPKRRKIRQTVSGWQCPHCAGPIDPPVVSARVADALMWDTAREANRVRMLQWRRDNGIKPAVKAQCGTAAGVIRHQRKGEPVCEACKEARRIAARERWARRKSEGWQWDTSVRRLMPPAVDGAIQS